MAQYIIQTIVFQILFLTLFELFFKKETFFQLNRFYLLVSVILSLCLPFIKIELLSEVAPQNFMVPLPEVVLGNTTTATTEMQATSIGFSIWKMVYMMGAIISTFIFICKWMALLVLKQKGNVSKKGNYTVVTIPNSTNAFSFLNTIYLGSEIDKVLQPEIMAHELVHIKQKHYVDMLFFETLRIILWFNPLIYVFQKKITALHEHIADRIAVEKVGNTQYCNTLLLQIFQTQQISFINTFFNQSLIKKRIVMLQKSKSKNILLGKYALILPLLLGMLFYVSCTEETVKTEDVSVEQKIEELKYAIENDPSITDAQRKEYEEWMARQQSIANSLDADATGVPFSLIDKVPRYPACKGTNDDIKKCVSEKIARFVNKNFNIAIAEELSLSGKQRITVQFAIDTDGSIVNAAARSPHEKLTQEALRVINQLPPMIPGEQEGKPVKVLYSLPILLDLQK